MRILERSDVGLAAGFFACGLVDWMVRTPKEAMPHIVGGGFVIAAILVRHGVDALFRRRK